MLFKSYCTIITSHAITLPDLSDLSFYFGFNVFSYLMPLSAHSFTIEKIYYDLFPTLLCFIIIYIQFITSPMNDTLSEIIFSKF